MLRKKSRCNWIKLSDANSKFFHSVMKGRFRSNNMVGMESVRGRLMRVEDIKIGVFRHFKNQFSKSVPLCHVLDGEVFNSLSKEEKDMGFREGNTWNWDLSIDENRLVGDCVWEWVDLTALLEGVRPDLAVVISWRGGRL
ncbi:unnamed protein product [Vicia faba]|uniref:Uncharacterized protein n=1 Tax=Vicia faba TaxID=3906 RepID=A0AAV0ZGZ4_VICFA|nr:unnamed protein product [Vicia faba]